MKHKYKHCNTRYCITFPCRCRIKSIWYRL